MKGIVEYINEVSGWKLEDSDWTWVNTEEDGKDVYAVRLWTGSGYLLDAYAAYANNEEEALCYTVIWLEENDPKTKCFCDKQAKAALKEEGIDPDESPWTAMDGVSDEWLDEYLGVDATEGSEMLDEYNCNLTHFAKEPHYVRQENLKVEKFTKNKIPKKA